jgi:hypothetical protein
MKRSIRMIVLGLAVAAILPMAGQAKPQPGDRYVPAYLGIQTPKQPIPYLSQGVGVDESYLGGGSSSSAQKSVGIPYLSQGIGVTPAELGYSSGQSSDDRAFSRATSVGAPVVESSNSSSVDWRDFTVTGFALGLILAMGGLTFAVWHRRDKLSPA